MTTSNLRDRRNGALKSFFLRVAFAEGFPADLGEAGVLEQGGGDRKPKVALSLRDRAAERGKDADWPLRAGFDSGLDGAFGFPVAERQGYVLAGYGRDATNVGRVNKLLRTAFRSSWSLRDASR